MPALQPTASRATDGLARPCAPAAAQRARPTHRRGGSRPGRTARQRQWCSHRRRRQTWTRAPPAIQQGRLGSGPNRGATSAPPRAAHSTPASTPSAAQRLHPGGQGAAFQLPFPLLRTPPIGPWRAGCCPRRAPPPTAGRGGWPPSPRRRRQPSAGRANEGGVESRRAGLGLGRGAQRWRGRAHLERAGRHASCVVRDDVRGSGSVPGTSLPSVGRAWVRAPSR